MFCPVCNSEYRPGFSRCGTCDVDLVDELTEATGASSGHPGAAPSCDEGPQVDFCGFLGLEDARHARDSLWAAGIRSEISIRPSPGSSPGSGFEEEYWIRVSASRFRTVAGILGYDTTEEMPAATSARSFQCSACGGSVPADESFCPGCGVSFDR